jgi:hypothetical protein
VASRHRLQRATNDLVYGLALDLLVAGIRNTGNLET